MLEDCLRIRVGQESIHYGSGITAGAYVFRFFGDFAGAMSIRHDGDGGLLAGYERVEFHEPVYPGDRVHVTGRLVRVGNTSRTYELECTKLVTHGVGPHSSSGHVLDPPVLVARATGTAVVRKNRQRRTVRPSA